MRIYFIGTTDYSKALLKWLLDHGYDVAGVATKRDTGFNADYADLRSVCVERNVHCDLVDDINAPEQVQRIREVLPDVIFCFGWNHLLREPLLSLAPLGAVGHHPAALPCNRGRHPLIWAIALGLEETASTFFYLDSGVDSGDIISQAFFPIEYQDTASTVYRRMTSIAIRQLEEFAPQLANGTVRRVRQDATRANYWRKRGFLDGQIDFRMNPRRIYDLVRALTHPFVGAHLVYKNQPVKVWAVREVTGDYASEVEPGKVLRSNSEAVRVKTFDGAVDIVEHEFDGIPGAGEYLYY